MIYRLIMTDQIVWNLRDTGMTSSLKVNMLRDCKIKCQKDALVWSRGDVRVEGHVDGGVIKSIKRWVGGGNFLLQTIKCESDTAEIVVAAKDIGSLKEIVLSGDNDRFVINRDGFVACDESIEISSFVQGIGKALFSKQGLVLMDARGKGTLYVHAYGDIDTIELGEGEILRADNGFLVGWTANTKYSLKRGSKSGFFHSVVSGEGLVCEFVGPGTVMVATHVKPPPPVNNGNNRRR